MCLTMRLLARIRFHDVACKLAAILALAGCATRHDPGTRAIYTAQRGGLEVMNVPVVSDVAVIEEMPRTFIWRASSVRPDATHFEWEVAQPDLAAIMKDALPRASSETANATVRFPFNSARLDARAQAGLNVLPTDVEKVRIDGYTDNVGAPAYNARLSERRADAVKNYLVVRGIDSMKISTEGHGAANPVASGRTAAGRAANRRADVTETLQ